jgi:hypothetical protein
MMNVWYQFNQAWTGASPSANPPSVQYPEHKSVMIAFLSKQGAGKGEFVRFLEKNRR